MLRLLPLIAGILPFLAVTVAYWMGVWSGRLPSCIPYVDGCTSISSTGRHPPGSFVFKGVHLPFSVLLAVIWFLVARWLQALGERGAGIRWIPVAGIVGAIALMIYTVFLGTTEPLYEFMRRFGIYFYFLGTWLAQLGTALYLQKCGAPLVNVARLMLVTCALPFALGLLNIVLKSTLENVDIQENRIEWLAALAMQAWFVLLYIGWRRTGIDLSVSVESTFKQN